MWWSSSILLLLFLNVFVLGEGEGGGGGGLARLRMALMEIMVFGLVPAEAECVSTPRALTQVGKQACRTMGMCT